MGKVNPSNMSSFFYFFFIISYRILSVKANLKYLLFWKFFQFSRVDLIISIIWHIPNIEHSLLPYDYNIVEGYSEHSGLFYLKIILEQQCV